MPIAEAADVVLTSDEASISSYKKKFPDKPVKTLKFAAPEKLCNPSGAPSFEERGSVAFAGGYYSDNHDDRNKQMEVVLPAIEAFSGVIFDRHSNNPVEKYRYPDRYKPFCNESVNYTEMIKNTVNSRCF